MAVRVRQWTRYGSMRSVEDTFTFDPVARLRVPIAGKTTGSIRINSLGFRSPELAVPKPIGVVRLAFLGGSTTYCAEVSSNEMTWPHLVWQSLSAALPESRLDYINAGVPGFSVEHLLLNLEKRVRPLAPDVIVIYEATNDFSSDSRELAIGQGLVDRGSPFRESWLSKYSLLWFLLVRNLTIWRLQAAVQDTAPVVAVAGFSARLRRAEAPDTQREAAITALYYMPYMTLDGLISGYEEYNRVIREVALHTGALYIGGEDSIPPDSAHYTDSVHFTDAGSRAMARRVSEALLGGSAFRRLLGRKTAAGGRRIYAEPAAAH